MACELPDFEGSLVPVRDDIVAAHRRYWQRLAAPGSWWTGAQRVEIAAEVRAARTCALCTRRKVALSPESVSGPHDRSALDPMELPDPAVDAVHRITTDATRITGRFVKHLGDNGVDDAAYVELVGIVTSIMSIDAVCRGLGIEPHALPAAEPGDPSQYRPAASDQVAFVATIPANGLSAADADLWDGRAVPNVVRAMSLVPDAVRDLKLLGGAHYLGEGQVIDMTARRTLDRPQMELLASRTSALNECFY